MNRGFLRIATVASVLALAVAAPSAANASAASTCAKQARAVTSAKKAVTKAQKAKAATPAARKQRAKRVKAAKAKHTRAKKTLATCKAKAKPVPAPAPVPAPVPAPAPMPAPLPAPAPAPPVLSLKETTINPTSPWIVAVIAPELPAGMHYRVRYDRPAVDGPPPTTTCVAGMTVKLLKVRTALALYDRAPWCVGAGTVSLHRVADTAGNAELGETLASIAVTVVP